MNLSQLVDSTMSAFLDDNKKSNPKDMLPFFNAILANEKLQIGITNTMQEISMKFAGVAMSGLEGDDLRETLCKLSIAKPLLGMMFIAYLLGKAAKEAEELDTMLGLGKEQTNVSSS